MVEDNVFDLMRGRLVKGLQSASIGALAQKHWAPFLISICLPDFEYNDGDKRSAHRGIRHGRSDGWIAKKLDPCNLEAWRSSYKQLVTEVRWVPARGPKDSLQLQHVRTRELAEIVLYLFYSENQRAFIVRWAWPHDVKRFATSYQYEGETSRAMRWDYMLSCEWLHPLKDLEAACFTKKEG